MTRQQRRQQLRLAEYKALRSPDGRAVFGEEGYRSRHERRYHARWCANYFWRNSAYHNA